MLFLLILGVTVITLLEIVSVSLLSIFKTSPLLRLRMKIVPCLISVRYLFVLYLLVTLGLFSKDIYNHVRMYVPIKSLSVGFFILIPRSGTMLDLVGHLNVFLTDPKAC